MNILVCIKQVPDTTEIQIDPVTNTLIRDGVPSIVNPFDGYAVEMAARLRDEMGGQLVVMSMGPPQAMKALRECVVLGADKAYLVSDRAFGGSDTLATSFILSRAVKAVEEKEGKFDIIFCGKQAIDGDTAQVGPEMAEHLDYAQITFAVNINEVKDGKIYAERETDIGKENWEATLPAVITTNKPDFEPRYPQVRRRLMSNQMEIPVLTIGDINADAEKCGLKGSPTTVQKSFVPQRKSGGLLIEGETAAELAANLSVKLTDDGLV